MKAHFWNYNVIGTFGKNVNEFFKLTLYAEVTSKSKLKLFRPSSNDSFDFLKSCTCRSGQFLTAPTFWDK